MKILMEESSKEIRLEADCDFDFMSALVYALLWQIKTRKKEKKIDDALNFMKTIDKCMELSEMDKDIKNIKDAFCSAKILIKKAREINENEKIC